MATGLCNLIPLSIYAPYISAYVGSTLKITVRRRNNVFGDSLRSRRFSPRGFSIVSIFTPIFFRCCREKKRRRGVECGGKHGGEGKKRIRRLSYIWKKFPHLK